MKMVEIISTKAFAGIDKNRTKRLIVRVSFEGRSIRIPELLKGNSDISISAFTSERHSDLACKNQETFRTNWPKANIVPLDTQDPVKSAMSIAELIEKHSTKDGLDNTLIDISSFRREELLILIAVIKSLNLPENTSCQIAYVSAENMAKDWLSRHVIGHRSVFGFPGEIKPSRKTKLVVMVGFGEIDRVKSIIENYEPSKVLLGMGQSEGSTNKKFYERNKDFFTDFRRQFSAEQLESFYFSVHDPLETARNLGEAVDLKDNTNTIIAPLNSKLSTIGAGLFALRNPSVQICYAPVEEYNEETYSTPGKEIRIIPLADLLRNP